MQVRIALPRVLSVAPHIHSRLTNRKQNLIMSLILLLPLVYALFLFGTVKIAAVAASASGALLADFIGFLLLKRLREFDFSALPFALLWAAVFPVEFILPAIFWSSFLGILLSRWPFGGLTGAFISPFIIAYSLVTISWPDLFFMPAVHQPFFGESLYAALSDLSRSTGGAGFFIRQFMGFAQQSPLDALNIFLIITALIYGILRFRSLFVSILFIIFYFLFQFLFLGTDLLLYETAGSILTKEGLVAGAFLVASESESRPYTCFGKVSYAFLLAGLSVILQEIMGLSNAVFYAIFIMSFFMPFINRVSLKMWLKKYLI
jgi:Na+-translocating ferredoxin:NAD+ oxidoreductase RnfD subunit